MNFSDMENQRIAFMKAVAQEIANHESHAVLKGGTALLLAHGLNRFSEDMDFDLPKGSSADFQKHIMRAAESVGINIKDINIKKDTETTKRYMVHFEGLNDEPGRAYPLKIECSMRNKIDKSNVVQIDGMNVYDVAHIGELKANAFVGRDKGRDTYDIAFLIENYASELRPETWKLIKKNIDDKGIDSLCDAFEREKAKDDLLKDFDGIEILLKLQENIRKHDIGIEIETHEPKISREEGPNMAEIQAAELKASLVQGLDKSADGNTHIEGQDIGYAEEGYVAAANEVKYEAQRARTADGEAKNRGLENPQVGQRVTFHAHGSEIKLTGNVVSEDKDTVTMKCGNKEIPTARGKGIFTEAPPLAQNHTKEYAKEQAQHHVGKKGKVFFAQTEGAYKGTIVGKTPTFAIQKVNAETAILHRLKDLEAKDKDSQGLIQEGEDVSIVKDGRSVLISPYDKEREEKDKVRERQKSRGGQSL